MKRLVTTCCVAVGLLLPMTMTSTVQAQPLERHPEIHEAIHSLENARAHLLEARHDYSGHRDAAIHAIDAAIEQLKVCLRYD